jgi:transcription elongation factor GreA
MSTSETAADALEVHVGSVVSFIDMGAGRDQTFTVVNPADADPSQGKLSMASPVARALLGRHVGDQVDVRTPKGVRPLVIAAIG